MRFLRMLTNAALGGALGATFVGILVLQLNPQLPLTPRVVVPLWWTLIGFYGANLGVAFYFVIVVRQLFAQRVLSPGWMSMRVLAWLTTLVAAGAAWLMAHNHDVFAPVLEPEAARRMALGAWATAGCALVLLVIAVLHYSARGRRASVVGATLFALTIVAALMLPLTARGWGGVAASSTVGAPLPPLRSAPGTPTRVRLLLLDGASLDYIATATATGRLPHWGRLLDAGASMHLTSLRPTQPAPVWTAATTGKLPSRNGVRSAATYHYGSGADPIELLPDLCFAHALVHLGLLEERPLDSRALRAPTVWQILSRFGVSVGLTGVPLSHPAFDVTGYVVSDRTHLVANTLLPVDDRGLVYPADLFVGRLPGPLDVSNEGPADLDPGDPLASLVPALTRGQLTPRDEWYLRTARLLDARIAPQVSAVRLDGIDAAGHLFLRYSMPRAFGDVSDREIDLYGPVLERQYAALDAEIGHRLAELGADEVLMVVSGFGMEPVSPGKRILARLLGEPAFSGSHEGAPDGFLIAFGGPVRAGRLPLGSVVDLTPTLLYLLGVPVGRDMTGTARTDLFRPDFTATRPVTFIPTHDR